MRLRLPLPSAVLSVSALPAYLPVAVPVDKPLLETRGMPPQASVGEPFQWTLRVAADGITAEGVKQLLRLPEGDRDGLRFYAAQYAVEEDKTSGKDALEIVVPVLPTRAGQPRLPALALPYFDPQTQRMEHVRIDAATVPVSDPFWRRIAWLGAGLAAAFAIGLALWQGRRLWRRRRARQLALQRVAQAANARELAQAVCKFSGAPHPGTLRQWLAGAPAPQSLVQRVEELEQACFGAQPGHDLNALKQGWVAALKGLRIT
jgi:hypothetical protein